MPTQAHRNDRQADAFPRLTPCTIIGCGATGRHLALQLAACGVPHLTLFDFDTIEELNLGPQGWSASDIGKLKTAALFEDILHLRPDITVEAQHRRWRRPDGHAHGGIVFCCVDTMEARELIWESCKARAEFFCDARMSAEITRIIAHTAEHPIDYASTLFTDDSEMAYEGPCTFRSTNYTAAITAALMVNAYSRWLRGVRSIPDFVLNLPALELFRLEPAHATSNPEDH